MCVNVSVRALSICPCVCLCVCESACVLAGVCSPGKACLSVPGTSLAFLSPKVPQQCPQSRKAGRGGGGQAHRAVPKLSLFITATEMRRGRRGAGPLLLTHCDHLLLHFVSVQVGGCANVPENKMEYNILYFQSQKCVFYI